MKCYCSIKQIVPKWHRSLQFVICSTVYTFPTVKIKNLHVQIIRTEVYRYELDEVGYLFVLASRRFFYFQFNLLNICNYYLNNNSKYGTQGVFSYKERHLRDGLRFHLLRVNTNAVCTSIVYYLRLFYA